MAVRAVCAEILRVREREREPPQRLRRNCKIRTDHACAKACAKSVCMPVTLTPPYNPHSPPPPYQRICKAAEFLTALQILHHHRQLANFTHTYTQATLTAFSSPAKRHDSLLIQKIGDSLFRTTARRRHLLNASRSQTKASAPKGAYG